MYGPHQLPALPDHPPCPLPLPPQLPQQLHPLLTGLNLQQSHLTSHPLPILLNSNNLFIFLFDDQLELVQFGLVLAG
jgi:hypothetical protein